MRDALARVTASTPFAKSARLQRFLTWVVDRAITGHAEDIKEYSIALAVFDRDESFDPRIDTIVRVEARRLRQALVAYYSEEGATDNLVISLPAGTYVPTFTERVVEAQAPPQRYPVRLIAALVAALLATGALVLAWTTVRRGDPHHWSMQNGKLLVFDESDRVCWERRIDHLPLDYERLAVDRVVILDIDGDGSPEVLVNQVPEKRGDMTGALLCFDSRGRLRWTHEFGRAMSFAGRRFEMRYVGQVVTAAAAGGIRFVVAIANHYLWYPSRAVLLDPLSGSVVEEYWHPGCIYGAYIRDVDRDGQPELIFSAINNPGQGLGHAAVGILRLPFSRQKKQAFSADDPLRPLTGGGEMAYALLPRPDINTAMGLLPLPVHLAVTPSNRIVVTTQMPDGAMVFQLDFALSIVDHRPSDSFAATHERLYRQKLLDHPLRPGELDRLGRAARFRAAPDGNSEAVSRLFAP